MALISTPHGEDRLTTTVSMASPTATLPFAAGPGYVLSHASPGLRAQLDDEHTAWWRVLRVGPSDMALAADSPTRIAPGRRAALRLLTGDRVVEPLPVEVTAVRGGNGRTGPDAAVRLLPPGLDAARKLYAVLDDMRRRGELLAPPTADCVVEFVSTPERVRAVVRALVANRAEGLLVGADGSRCRVRAVPQEAGAFAADAPLPLRWEVEGLVPTRPSELRLVGFNSVFVLPVDDRAGIDTARGLLATAMPYEVRRERRRALRRTRALTGLEVAWRHPVFTEVRVQRPVRDLSLGGLSFWTSPSDDLLMPGSRLDDLVVLEQDRPVARFRAEVRQISQPDEGMETCAHLDRCIVGGLRLVPMTSDDHRRWASFVPAHMTPRARTGGTRVDEAWDLYDASGYFRMSNTRPEDFEPLRPDYAAATARLDEAPDLGCQVVWPSPRGVEASISIVKLYQGTYFPGQLARRPGGPDYRVSGRRVLRDIHLRAYEHLQADPDFRWLLVFVHEGASWTQMAYRDFPKRYRGTERVWDEPFEAWVGRLSPAAEDSAMALAGSADASGGHGIEIGPATSDEVRQLVEFVQWTRGPVYADALDLVPNRVALTALSGRWAAAQLAREREIVVARRNGEVLAVALFESGEKGLHLFSMFDSVRAYDLRACPGSRRPAATGPSEAEPDPRTLLLRAARRWFALRGRDEFKYFLEGGDGAHAEAAGLRPLGGANQLILSSELVPDFLECIFEVTAPGSHG